MDSALIRTRRDLAQHLQAQMIASRTPWAAEAEDVEASGRTQVKTYLLEAHQDGQHASATLDSAATAFGARVHPTKDADLFRIEEGGLDFWCDTSMGRFWKLHSVAPVASGDNLRDRLVRATPRIDNVWLSPRYLEQLAERTGTRMQTFTLNHDRRDLHQAAAEGHDFESVTLRLWSSRAQETLLKLREARVFPRGLSIRSVKVRSGGTDESDDFCVAEYFNNGKVTANGTSFDEHMRLITTVLRDYQGVVEGIEKRHGIGYADDGDGHVHLSGDPIIVDLKWSVDDLEYAVGRMFASVEPFRLWALPERLSSDHYRAHAVDLHVGATLSFDITRDNIVITLPQGTCGNTVVRFLASLSYHVDSDYQADAGAARI